MASALETANLIHAPQAFRQPGEHDVEIALHEIEPSLVGPHLRREREHRVLTIMDVERGEVLAAGFITLAEAAEIIGVILAALQPHSNVCLRFCQGAEPTPALRQYLQRVECPFEVARVASPRYWQRDGVARGSGYAAVLAATAGQANRRSVELARQVMAAASITSSLLPESSPSRKPPPERP